MNTLINFLNPTLISQEPNLLKQRLLKRLSLGEFIALAICFIFPIGTIFLGYVNIGGQAAYDFQHYLNTANGDFSFYYYAYWFLPVWQFLSLLPLEVSYTLWTWFTTLAIFAASRVFGGNPTVNLITYTMLAILYFGQFVGVIVGGLALMWWGLSNKKWNLAGFGFLLAASKYHTGLIPAITLLLCFETAWSNRLRTLIVPLAIGLLSLIIYPLWPLDVLNTYQLNPANDWGSVTLWKQIGAFSLLLWLPTLLIKMPWQNRIFAVISTLPLAIPYYQMADLMIMFIFPIGWLPILSNVGLLFPWLGYRAVELTAIIPIIVYASTIGAALITNFENRK